MDQLTIDTSLAAAKNRKSLLLVFRVTAVVYLALAAAFYAQLSTKINPDGIAYLTIAKNYAHGYWSDALSAYWSPLLSWILAPFCWIVQEPLFVFYSYNVLVGLAGMWACTRLVDYFKFGSWSQVLVLPVCAVFFLRFAYNTSTPDLTSVVLLLFFLHYWLVGGLLAKPVVTAAWIAVLYYAKAYNIYFAAGLVGYDLVSAILNKRIPLFQLSRKVVTVLGVCFLLLAPWLFALHSKYGNLMLAGTSKFNHGSGPGNLTMLGKGIPGVEGKLKNNYDFMLQFVEPPHDHSIFAWEDPVAKADYRDYAVFSSKENFLLQLRVILTNFRVLTGRYIDIYNVVSIGLLLLAVCVLMVLLNWRRNSRNALEILETDTMKLAFFYGLYIVGYSLFFLEERYVWINVILAVISTGLALKMMTMKWETARQVKPNYLPKLVLTCMISGYFFYQFFWAHYFDGKFQNAEVGRYEYAIGKQIKPLPAEQKRMVHWPGSDDNALYCSWFTAYFAEGRHYNCLPEDIVTSNALIEKNGISYVFVAEDRLIPETFIISRWKKAHIPRLEMNMYTKP